LVWETEFKREMVGKMPTEMFLHFFKSFSDGAKQTSTSKPKELMSTIKLGYFKAFAKAISGRKTRYRK
jgi:imidazoleglycerol-phosphate dehydratase/histidinol-phosphatase